jgi:hypothetical protein
MGDKIRVKVIAIDDHDRVKLSRKALLREEKGLPPAEPSAPPPRGRREGGDGGGRGRREGGDEGGPPRRRREGGDEGGHRRREGAEAEAPPRRREAPPQEMREPEE